MDDPVVNIITPAHNAAQTLRTCVESIRAQSFQGWEHIIVDDGSTDDTWALLNDLSRGDTRLRIMRQANTGQGQARNVAIKGARGKYIALLDADDWSLPERLETQAAFLEAHPEVDVLGGAIINISAAGEDLGVSRLASDHDTLAADIYRRCPFFTSTVMGREMFFRTLGGFAENRSMQRVEDYDLWLRGFSRFRYHNLQTPLCYYRRNTTPSWRDAYCSARVVAKAIRRDKKSFTQGRYVLKPFLAVAFQHLGLLPFHP
jgi:glycosyltransferase involved in cell wall biosynthesis